MTDILDSDELATRYRERGIRHDTRELLIARIEGSEQAGDLTVPPNCGGYGRIRHFRLHQRSSLGRWMPNPLPITPACYALRLPLTSELRAQAFQNAACNWRCWYCYVPFNLLAADERRAAWLTADELVERYARLSERPRIIDLTGGQPDLVPEWVPWTMRALERQGLAQEVYLWSDDNLSNDYFWKYLSTADVETVASWPNYGRVCCFKGFDAASFSFNTAASGALFERQFELFRRLLELGLDLYAYVTLTTPDRDSIAQGVPRFMDRLQNIDPNLPLRTVPLEVQVFTPVRRRLTNARTAALEHQYRALEAFNLEVEQRFSSEMRALPISEVPLGRRLRG